MSLGYILKRVASEQGFDYANNPGQRERALDKVWIACEAIWEETDLPGCCEEILMNVSADSEISLPSFVGDLRAMREKGLMTKWTLNDMRPRYQNEPWKQMWRNWRHLGYRAVAFQMQNTSPLTLVNPAANGAAVTITGSTTIANAVSETVVFDTANIKVTFNSFTKIESIVRVDETPSVWDIIIKDTQENILAVLYNTDNETRYICVDVSQYPFGGELVTGQRVMEVLYKRKLRKLIADSDCFPVPGWDNIIVDRTLQAIAESEEGKEQRAILYATKVEKQSHQKVRSQEGGIEKEVQFAENSFYGITRRPYSRIWRG